MTQKQKFMISESLLLLAYAYAASDYDLASAEFGVLALLSAVIFHSAGTLVKGIISIPLLSLAQIAFIRFLGLDELMPSLCFLAFCNTAFSFLWMKSSYKAVDDVMRIITGTYLLFLVFLLVLPADAVCFFAGGTAVTILQACAGVSLIFVPCIAGYTVKCLKDFRMPVHSFRTADKPMERQVHLR